MAASGTVVELRVHGVSGAPPEALLGCPVEFIERTAGGNDAGFYRRKPWLDMITSPTAPNQWRRVMEAYSWGALTSGRASRALWLLFLPFILVDLAHWMLPPARKKRSAVVVVTLLRLIALSFTLTLMLASAVAVMDVMVWQCANLDYCSAGPLTFLASWHRGAQLALAAVPLMAVMVLLWRLGSEETGVDTGGRTPPPSPAVVEGQPTPLTQSSFWNPDESVVRLRYCHVTAWSAGVAAVALAAPVRYAQSGGVRTVSVGLLVANAVFLGVAVLATASSRATARGGSGVYRLTKPLMVARWLSLGLLVATLVWVAVAQVAYPLAPTHLPGLHEAIYVLFVVQVALLLALFAFTAVSLRGTRGAQRTKDDGGWRMTLGGFTGPFVTLIGWLIGGGFSVGIGLLAAQTFGKAVLSTSAAIREKSSMTGILARSSATLDGEIAAVNADAPLIVPPPYVWASVATVAIIAVAVAMSIYVYFRVVPERTAGELPGVHADYPGQKDACEQINRIARARALASLTDVGTRMVAGMALVAVAAIVAMMVLNLSIPQFDSARFWSGAIFSFSVFISVALAAGLVTLVVAAYRIRQLRRVVAILWDVVTFWPRANHPLTPPSYGARTVWDIRLRLAALTEMAGPTRVVLVAHSQGTVIAAAALLQANTEDEHYPLLTFGSPLRRLYAQNFPAYFGPETLRLLRAWQEPTRQWINLWAHTDPIGAWIFDHQNTSPAAAQTHCVDSRLPDVRSIDGRPEPGAPICGHSGFWTRQEYTDAVEALQSTVMPAHTMPADDRATAAPMEELL
ncbi:hypothetical protein ACGFK1_30405 [Mycobacterium sp. NPDC048908]|uniref:hypothetical protein n=1 Tax=Mycobacterium sp. NPDC048908 TaxID=3364292 RepID=UPI0037116DC5